MRYTNIFNRILLVLGGIGMTGAVYWGIYTFLNPVVVPPAPSARTAAPFDPRTDISKRAEYQRLHPIGPQNMTSSTMMGRGNPFVPVYSPQAASSTVRP